MRKALRPCLRSRWASNRSSPARRTVSRWARQEPISYLALPGVVPAETAEWPVESLTDTVVSLQLPGIVFPLILSKVSALPERCNTTVDNDPQAIVDLLWENFNEYYAFFAERGVDWQAQYDQAQLQ